MQTHVDMNTACGLLVSLQGSANSQLAMKEHWAKENDIDMAEVALMEHHVYCDLSYYLGRLIIDAEKYKMDDGDSVLKELAAYADIMLKTLSRYKQELDETHFHLNNKCMGYKMKVYAFVRDTIWIMTKVSEMEKVVES